MHILAFLQGNLTDYWGFSSNSIDWGTVAWSATKTIAAGGLIIAGASAAVAAGVVSAPVLGAIGLGLAVGYGISSYSRRSNEAP